MIWEPHASTSLHFRMTLSYRESNCGLLTLRIVFQIFFCIQLPNAGGNKKRQYNAPIANSFHHDIIILWVKKLCTVESGWVEVNCTTKSTVTDNEGYWVRVCVRGLISHCVKFPYDSSSTRLYGRLHPITRRNYWRSRRIVCRVNPLVYRTAMQSSCR